MFELRRKTLLTVEINMIEEPKDPVEKAETVEDVKKKKKKKDKVRSAWISFAGRIVAQVVGALATVALTVTVVHQYKGNDLRQPKAAASAVTPDDLSVAVLPMENFSAESGHDYLAD